MHSREQFHSFVATAAAAFLALASAYSVFAQTETGQIEGTVLDPAGAVVANVTITASESVTHAKRQTISSSAGSYVLSNLLPGTWELTVTANGFQTLKQNVVVTVGARVAADLHLMIGTATTVVEVQESPVQVNTATQTLGQEVTGTQVRELPNLTRNPYQFVAIAGNVSDGGMGTRGAGFAINGQRESSTNLLLDGASNNDEFAGDIGQQVPLDSIQEFSVLTSNFTAEFGRASGGIVNVVTKSGSNDFHGTAYEFNRVSALSSTSFLNNANEVPKATFVRNQFGYSIGGPVKKDKLFFFSSTEWTRVRSTAQAFAWVPDPAFLALTPSNTQSFFQTLGGLRSSAQVLGTISLSGLTSTLGGNPCAKLACASLPANIPLFDHVGYGVPTDAGGGFPQNTYNTINRLDYNLSDRTQIYGRYALYSEVDSSGVLSSSPYANYDLGETYFNHNGLVSMIHTFSPTLTSQSKAVFNRLTNLQQGITSRGVVPTMYANPSGPLSIGSDNIAFPGYNPFTPGNGGAFGGPQNILQFYEDVSWVKGTHNFRFGATYDNLRDNRTYAAYQTAVDTLASSGGGIGPALSALMAGTFNSVKVAVNPQGHFPCVGGVVTPNCSVTLPVGSPSFSRSNRFNDGAIYAQDSWKLRPRLTINLGLRWEYFGTQHNDNPKLDSNWYAPNIGFADSQLGQYLRTGAIEIAPASPIGELWKASKGNFAPRLGVAWDMFGDGKTSFRAGYGIGYERNFGNVTFNVIQNPPNYAVLSTPPTPITTNNFGPLAGAGTTVPLPQVGARIVDPNIKTAYAHMWNTSIEHQFGRSVIWSVEYSGSKGVNLYTISYPNQNGFGNYVFGDPCTGNGDCTAQPNSAYSFAVGYRGNQGFSLYNALNNKVVLRNFMNSGVDLSANWTWSHAIDNMSSTFFEAAGVSSQYGNANITTNNGDFVVGLLDPYHPNVDKGNAEFDLRQRVTLAGNWAIPSRLKTGFAGRVLNGWSLNPLFVAHTGQPFSVFDSSSPLTLPYATQRAVFTGPVPTTGNGLTASGTPDGFNYITFQDSQINHNVTNPLTLNAKWPAGMSGRDAFTGPGWWDLDLGVYKDTRINERFSLQIRGEFFNLFNHANLYVVGTGADLGAGDSIPACYGCTGSSYDRRNVQLAAKLIF
ncbi:MAG TPA: carboxypeptidase regulatory-like domain-containing protein [Bryobacteraceae bacterium]|nr:carboxypeptidase regulatory-like domain-containing protein [Bryobacteraceae bacterium]